MNEDSWLWFTLERVCAAVAWLIASLNVKRDFPPILPSVCDEVGCTCDVQSSESEFF